MPYAIVIDVSALFVMDSPVAFACSESVNFFAQKNSVAPIFFSANSVI